MSMTQPTTVLGERLSPDGRCRWQARVSVDRGRLEVVGIVQPSTTPTVIEPLSDIDLRELLTGGAFDAHEPWTCRECQTPNSAERRWCRICSNHGGV